MWRRVSLAGEVLDLMHARITAPYAPHLHEQFAIGVCTTGAEMIRYRGAVHPAGPGSVVVLDPDEPHDGGPADPAGFVYRVMYPGISLLDDGSGRLPRFAEPVIGDPALANGLCRLHAALGEGTEPLEAESRVSWLLGELMLRHACRSRLDGLRPGDRASGAAARRVMDRLGDELIGPWGLLTSAERRLPSSLAGLLVAAVPIIGVVVARLTGGAERLGPRRRAGLVIGLAGVVVLAAPDLNGTSGWPVAEVLLVAVGYACAPLIAARALADVPSLPMTAACLSLAALVYAPAAFLNLPRREPSANVFLALAGLGVICTACAFIVFLELIKEVGPSRAMVFTYVNPAVAVAAGVALLGEPFTAGIVVSFALILAGCVLAASQAAEHARPGIPGFRRRRAATGDDRGVVTESSS